MFFFVVVVCLLLFFFVVVFFVCFFFVFFFFFFGGGGGGGRGIAIYDLVHDVGTKYFFCLFWALRPGQQCFQSVWDDFLGLTSTKQWG